MQRSLSDLLAAVESCRDAVSREAEAGEREGRLRQPIVDALVENGLFRLWLPQWLDGDELSMPESARVFEAMGELDGATGWAAAIGTGGGLFAAYLERSTAEAYFRDPAAVVAGSGSPLGTARPVEGGFMAGGHWTYASGAHYATIFTANARIEPPDAPPGAEPVIRAMSFPPEAVQLLDTWHVSGLRATGSVDFTVAERFVPAEHTFSVFTDAPREPGPLYRFPFAASAWVGFSAVALGIARHGLVLFERTLQEGPNPLRVRLDDARATLESARSWFHGEVRSAWDATVAGDPEETGQLQLAAAHAAEAAAHAVDLVYRVSGTRPLFLESEFGRTWRDVHALRQHRLLLPPAFVT